jgi:Caspase domain
MHRLVAVGISDYGGAANPLPGAVNDMNDWAGYVTTSLGVRGDDIRLLANAAATRPAILDSLRWLLSDTRPGEHRVFVFAGHGSRFRTKDAQTGAFSSEIHETFVAYPGGSSTLQDVQIFDHELASLIDGAKPHPQSKLTLVFDSCHSGGLLRSDFGNVDPIDYPAIPRCWIPPEKFATPKMAFWSLAPRTYHEEVPALSRGASTGAVLSGGFLSGNLDVPRLVVAAAQPDQSAWDDKLDDNRRHGVFSYYALQLIRDNPKRTWLELIAGAAAKIALKFPQKPLLLGDESRFGASLWP